MKDIQKNDIGLYETLIDDHKYEFEMWRAGDSTETLYQLMGLLGKGAMANVGALLRHDDGDGGKSIAARIALELFTVVGENRKEAMVLTRKLTSGKGVQCDGKKVDDFDEHYKNRLAHLSRVLTSNLKVQYGDFLTAILGVAGPGLA